MTFNNPFEEHAQQYDAWFDKHPTAYQAELNAIRKVLPKQGFGIEIGVGSGRFAVPLGISLGIEPSFAMTELAKIRGIKVVNGVAEKIPFIDNSFDFILLVTTICFVDDFETTLEEAYRILKPQGSLIIGFIDRESPLGEIYQQKKAKHIFYKEATFFSTQEITHQLNLYNFGQLQYYQTLFHSPEHIELCDIVIEGYGEGSFIVIKALKTN